MRDLAAWGQGRPGGEDAARIQPGRNYFGTLPRERHVPGARGAVEWRWTLGAIINAVALPLIRITETSTGQTWNQLRAELQRIHPGTFTGLHGTFTHRTHRTQFRRPTPPQLPVRSAKTSLVTVSTGYPRQSLRSRDAAAARRTASSGRGESLRFT